MPRDIEPRRNAQDPKWWELAIAGTIVILAFFGLCTAIIDFVDWTDARDSRMTYYNTGKITASGERFDKNALTMAVKHRENLGQWYKVTFNHKTICVRANDIMPANASADYDLAEGAFKQLADPAMGVIYATVKKVE